MEAIKNIQDTLKKVYSKNSRYINIATKFLLSLISYWGIGRSLNGFKFLANPIVIVILAAASAILPKNFIILISSVLILAHLLKISTIAMAITAAILIILLILYFRFTPKLTYVLLLTPIAFALKIPFIIPIVVGIVSAPFAFVATTCGTVGFFLLHNVKQYSKLLTGSESGDAVSQLSTFVSKVLTNKEMWLYIALFIVIITVVYLIRRADFNYSREVAIGVGALLAIIGVIIGNVMFGLEISIVISLIGIIIGAAIAYVGKVFVFSVDYKKVRKIQYEDDEYYYYVKAVPKVVGKKQYQDIDDEEEY